MHFFLKISQLPNIFGVILGIFQMTLYAIYKDGRKVIQKQNESEINKINCEVHAVSVPICEESEVGNKHENSYDHHHHTKPNGDSIESHNPSPTK